MYTIIRNLSTYAFLHTEIYHVAFLLEKNVRTFTAMFTALKYRVEFLKFSALIPLNSVILFHSFVSSANILISVLIW